MSEREVCVPIEERQLLMKGANTIDNTRRRKAKRKERISNQELTREQSEQLQHNITQYAYTVKNQPSTTQKSNIISSISQQKKTKRKKYRSEQKRQNENDTVGTNNKCDICPPHQTALRQFSLLKCFAQYQKSIEYS